MRTVVPEEVLLILLIVLAEFEVMLVVAWLLSMTLDRRIVLLLLPLLLLPFSLVLSGRIDLMLVSVFLVVFVSAGLGLFAWLSVSIL